MLYLIKSYGPRNRSILKVGFTDNVDKRTYQYVSAAPYNQLIAAREGDLILESLIHRYLYLLDFQFNKEGRNLEEWFIDDPEVLRVFHLSRETIERLVWRNRDKIFNIKSASSLDYSLFETLYKKNINKFERSQYKVVEGRVYKTKAKSVDVDFWNLFLKNERENRSIDDDGGDPTVNEFLEKEFYSTGNFTKRMEAFCRFMDSNKENKGVIDLILRKVEPRFNNYYSLFGTSGCRSICYRENILAERLKEYSLEDSLRIKVTETFEVGKRYTKKNAKAILKDIFTSFGLLTRIPKAIELEKWFEIKEVLIISDQKKDHGFEILGIKPLQNLISE